MTDFLKRTWAEIDLDCLDKNIEVLRSRLPAGAKVMAVVKADGYGHGDLAIARELAELGVDFFAVSNLAEALSLRRGGIRGNILILGFTPPARAADLAAYGLSQTVFSSEYARLLNDSCKDAGITVKIHIKLDTGMNRIGFDSENCRRAADEVEAVCRLPYFSAEGIFTHLSSADSLESESLQYTEMQIARYNNVLNELIGRGISFPCRHLQNSAGIAFQPQLNYDYARAGIVLYGVAPSGEPLPFELYPLMSLKTVISMVKTVPKGVAVSYNRRFVSPEEMTIATVPIGYADGYPRLLSNQAQMLVHGQRARVIGNVCMDQLMLDVSGIDGVQMGDTVTVVGRDGEDEIRFSELAGMAKTISYELMCLIGRRVPRVYRKQGETVGVVDYVGE